MKNLLILITLAAGQNVSAWTGFTTTNSAAVDKITAADLQKLEAGTDPVCVKDGGKVLAANKAFHAAGFKKSDCSNSAANLEKMKMRGFNLRVIKTAELPVEEFKKFDTRSATKE
jgi:hypothetical protein